MYLHVTYMVTSKLLMLLNATQMLGAQLIPCYHLQSTGKTSPDRACYGTQLILKCSNDKGREKKSKLISQDLQNLV